MAVIYLSSTYEDLKGYRQQVISALRMGGDQVINMEEYVACDQRPVDKCLDDVEKADFYIGIFAWRYGYIPPTIHNNPEQLSITELEFRHAVSCHVPIFVFIANGSVTITRDFDDLYTGEGENGQRIATLRKYLRTEYLASDFSDPSELTTLVQAAVSRFKAQHPSSSGIVPPPVVTWSIEKKGSPYPGLMHFTRKYAPVFFGREVEVIEILERLHSPESRFLLISGNSGSGKSSLVDAGVLPKLEENVVFGGPGCTCIRMVPSQGAHPFDALRRVLQSQITEAGRDPQGVAEQFSAGPETFSRELQEIIDGCREGKELVLFLDQMEELFTSGSKWNLGEGADAFLTALYHAAYNCKLRVIATLRGDFLHYCFQHSDMLKLLKGRGHYPLGPIPPRLLDDVIEKPARCADLSIEPTLVQRLIEDTGDDPGNLPLLAFVLHRLFSQRENKKLTERVYAAFGGIRGAIEEQTKDVEQSLARLLGTQAPERLSCLFQALLFVNLEGQPIRRRIVKSNLPVDLASIADNLAARRLVVVEGEGVDSTVCLAHEKLFEAWPTLAQWIAENRDDLMMVRQAEFEAREWQRHKYGQTYLWHPDRLKRLQGIMNRLEQCEFSSLLREYSNPTQVLVKSLMNPELCHRERYEVGELLAQLGDPRPGVGLTADGIPDIEWVPIRGGTVILEGIKERFCVSPFKIARYPVTTCQFEAFLKADGYQNQKWWKGIRRIEPDRAHWSQANTPRETVSWCEAVAFCRWITRVSRDLGLLNENQLIRLPTEWEWQQAATRGYQRRRYPWGDNWDTTRCNSFESGLNCTIAVGMYPDIDPNRPLDMSGNVWEWCLNKYNKPNKPEAVSVDDGGALRTIRGGAWDKPEAYLNTSYRDRTYADAQSPTIGFRIALIYKGEGNL